MRCDQLYVAPLLTPHLALVIVTVPGGEAIYCTLPEESRRFIVKYGKIVVVLGIFW
jgi:hypothetical protein